MQWWTSPAARPARWAGTLAFCAAVCAPDYRVPAGTDGAAPPAQGGSGAEQDLPLAGPRAMGATFPTTGSMDGESRFAGARLAELPVLAAASVQRALLDEWFAAVGERRDGEDFAHLVIRTALAQRDRPYAITKQRDEPEHLAVELRTFECVSFVESSLAVARCVWAETPTVACFLGDLEASRYRDGRRADYASRLHYFSDWLADNAARARLHPLTEVLGGTRHATQFDYMTRHLWRYPRLRLLDQRRTVREIEQRLSAMVHPVLPETRLRQAQAHLRNGDVVAIVGNEPGLLVNHAGFLWRDRKGTPRLLHASSFRYRVVPTVEDLASYVLHRDDRVGVLVARPVP